eukprot:scaffold3145_cov101-Isochrysis_galbana.AAC.3
MGRLLSKLLVVCISSAGSRQLASLFRRVPSSHDPRQSQFLAARCPPRVVYHILSIDEARSSPVWTHSCPAVCKST